MISLGFLEWRGERAELVQDLTFDACVASLCQSHGTGTVEHQACVSSCFTLYYTPPPAGSGASSAAAPTVSSLPFSVLHCIELRCSRLSPTSSDYRVCEADCRRLGSDGGGGITNLCGDGLLQSGEECDDGNQSGSDGCSSSCDIELRVTPLCGNSVLEGFEECDDGNAVGGDGCSASCTAEAPIAHAPFCFGVSRERTFKREECAPLILQHEMLFGPLRDRLSREELTRKLAQDFGVEVGASSEEHVTLLREVQAEALLRLEPLLLAGGPSASAVAPVVSSLRGLDPLEGAALRTLLIEADRVIQGEGFHGSTRGPEEVLGGLTLIFQKFPAYLQIFVEDVAGGQEDADRAYAGYGAARQAFLAARTSCAGEGEEFCSGALLRTLDTLEEMRWMQAMLQESPIAEAKVRALFADLHP